MVFHSAKSEWDFNILFLVLCPVRESALSPQQLWCTDRWRLLHGIFRGWHLLWSQESLPGEDQVCCLTVLLGWIPQPSHWKKYTHVTIPAQTLLLFRNEVVSWHTSTIRRFRTYWPFISASWRQATSSTPTMRHATSGLVCSHRVHPKKHENILTWHCSRKPWPWPWHHQVQAEKRY